MEKFLIIYLLTYGFILSQYLTLFLFKYGPEGFIKKMEEVGKDLEDGFKSRGPVLEEYARVVFALGVIFLPFLMILGVFIIAYKLVRFGPEHTFDQLFLEDEIVEEFEHVSSLSLTLSRMNNES